MASRRGFIRLTVDQRVIKGSVAAECVAAAICCNHLSQAKCCCELVSNRSGAWLQDNLLVRARLEAEDAQRVLLGALNGLAGLMLLDGKGAEAVATFREVLSIGGSLLPSSLGPAQCWLANISPVLSVKVAHWPDAASPYYCSLEHHWLLADKCF